MLLYEYNAMIMNQIYHGLLTPVHLNKLTKFGCFKVHSDSLIAIVKQFADSTETLIKKSCDIKKKNFGLLCFL